MIESGEGLERWRDDPKLLVKREAALEKVRVQLTGPQPARKRLRRPRRHETTLQPGDVLAYRSERGDRVMLRVQRIDVHRLSVAPIVRLLNARRAARAQPARRLMGPDVVVVRSSHERRGQYDGLASPRRAVPGNEIGT